MSIYLHENIYITKVSSKKLRVFEAFAGIGSQRRALDKVNVNYEIAGMAEWFIPAIVSYQAIHNNLSLETIKHEISLEEMIHYLESKTISMDSKQPVKSGFWKRKHLDEVRIVYEAVKMSEREGNIFDVRTLFERKLSDVDLLTYSFPCQDLSQQGKQKGMSKGNNTRSGLLWEIEKALDSTPRNKLPKYLLMENVMAITNSINKNDLELWKQKLSDLGYKNDLQVLNSANFGSPQSRNRAFMISSLGKKVDLPLKNKNEKRVIADVLDAVPREKDFLPALGRYDLSPMRRSRSNINKSELLNYSTFHSETYVYDPLFNGPTLTASGANSRIKLSFDNRIRKINAREAFQYMGFEIEDYERVNRLNYLNEQKMIYICGNSISVEVLEEIFRRL